MSQIYLKDYNTDTTGAEPSGITKFGTQSSYSVETTTTYEGAKALETTYNTSASHTGIWYATGHADGDFAVIAPFRSSNAGSSRFGTMTRCWDDGGTQKGYFAALRSGNSFRLGELRGSSETTLETDSISSISNDTWYFVEIQSIGSAIKARYWEDGDGQPSNWQAEQTDTSFGNTRVGAGKYFYVESGVTVISDQLLVDDGDTDETPASIQGSVASNDSTGTTVTQSITTDSDTDALVVFHTIHQGTSSGVDFDSDAFTKIREENSAFDETSAVYFFNSPASKTADVVATRSGGSWHGIGVYKLQDCPALSVSTINAGTKGTSSTPDIDITPTADNSLILSAVCSEASITSYLTEDWAEVGASYENGEGQSYTQAIARKKNILFTTSSSQRYAIVAIAIPPASGGTADSDSRSFVITGKDTANDNRSFKITGKDTASDNRSFKLTGTYTGTDNRSFVITGKDTANDSRSFKITGTLGANDSRPFVITGKLATSDSRSFKTTGKATANDNRSFVVTGVAGANDSRSFVITGSLDSSDSRNFVLTGSAGANDNRSFVVTGTLGSNDNRSFVITGSVDVSDNRGFTVTGVAGSNDSRSFVVTGKDTTNDNRSFVITGSVSDSDNRSFKLTGENTTPVPAGKIIAWDSTHASIPTGWSRATEIDGVYIKGTANGVEPNTTATGSNTHTHTSPNHNHTLNSHTHSVSLNASTAGGKSTGSTSSGAPTTNHGHVAKTSSASSGGTLNNATSTYEAVNHEPPYRKLIWIESLGTHGIPDGGIMLWDYLDGGLRDNWDICDGNNGTPDLGDVFIKGSATGADSGGTGGSLTHTGHNIAHTHTETGHTHPSFTSGTYTATTDFESASGTADSVVGHSHDISLNSNTVGYSGTASSGSGDNQPEFTKLMFVQNNTGTYDYDTYGIGLWIDTLASIPSSHVLCDGTNSTIDMRDQYLKGASSSGEVGDTGGSNTHTHSDNHSHTGGSHNHTATVEVQAVTNNQLNSGNSVPNSHGHTAVVGSTSVDWGSSATTADSSSNEPEHITVAFIKSAGLPASDTRNFVLTGTTTANDNRSFVLTGGLTDADSRSFRLTGIDTISDSRLFLITGTATASSSRSFKIRGLFGWTIEPKPATPVWTKEAKPSTPTWTKEAKPSTPIWTKEPKTEIG